MLFGRRESGSVRFFGHVPGLFRVDRWRAVGGSFCVKVGGRRAEMAGIVATLTGGGMWKAVSVSTRAATRKAGAKRRHKKTATGRRHKKRPPSRQPLFVCAIWKCRRLFPGVVLVGNGESGHSQALVVPGQCKHGFVGSVFTCPACCGSTCRSGGRSLDSYAC